MVDCLAHGLPAKAFEETHIFEGVPFTSSYNSITNSGGGVVHIRAMIRTRLLISHVLPKKSK